MKYHIPQLQIRRVGECALDNPILDNSEKIVQFWDEVVARSPSYENEKEMVAVFLLNRKNRLKSWNLVSMGTGNAALVSPSQVFRLACIEDAAAIVVGHNHPSGDPTPSSADLQITRQLQGGARILDISFQDHVIVGKPTWDPSGLGYYSFKSHGII